jgi:hypothetical protein
MTQPQNPEPWTPVTRDDFVNMYADALDLHHNRRTEAEEKAKAAEAEAQKATEQPKRRSAAERLMGIRD